MRSRSLPSPRLASTVIHKSLMLLAGAFACLSPLTLSAQSVTFTGAQMVLPGSAAATVRGVAVDSAGDVFLAGGNESALNGTNIWELPRTLTGYGMPMNLTPGGVNGAYCIAVDGAGDLFFSASSSAQINGATSVLELPKTASGYGAQEKLPFSGLDNKYLTGVAVDGSGDVFVADQTDEELVELPKTETGFGTQIALASNLGPFLYGAAADSAGDLFFATTTANEIYTYIEELPKTETGYGPLTPVLTSTSLPNILAVAVNSTGDLFFSDLGGTVGELPKIETGYGPQIFLPFSNLSGFNDGIAADSGGDVFVTDYIDAQFLQVQQPVPFSSAVVCAPGQTPASSCSQTATLNFTIDAVVALGTPKVLTGGAPNLDFTLASGGTCTGSLAADATCTVNVKFAPLATGVRNGSVEIVDGDGNVLTTIALVGTGVAATTTGPVAQVSTTLLQFDTVPFGSTDTLPVTVTNIGGGTLTVDPSINGQSFVITGNTCAAGLTAGESCTLELKFSPVIVGPHDDLLTLLTNGSTSPVVKMKGVASGVGTAIRVLNFGTVPAYTKSVVPLTITNFDVPGTVTIGTAISGNSFTILTDGNTCMAGITAGQSCNLPVEFLANSVGTHNEQLTLTPSGGAAASVVHLDAVEAAP